MRDKDGIAWDMRYTVPGGYKRRGGKKSADSKRAWGIEFPNVPYPNFYGSTFYAYDKLEAAGWKWSSRHGWRKQPQVR